MTTSAIGKLADVDLDVKPMRMVDTTFNLNPTKDYGLSSDLADYGERTIVPWLQKTYQSDSIAGQALRGLGWIGEQHSKIPGYDLAERTLGQTGGKIAGAIGVDPRIGMLVGSILMPDITDVVPGIGGALGTASKTARKVAGESAGRAGRILNDLQRGVAHSYNPVLHDMPSYGYQRGLGVSGLGDDVSLAARTDELIQNQERILSGLYNKKQLEKIRKHPLGNELIELVLSHQGRLSRVEAQTFTNGSFKVWPGSEHELITSAQKLIKLKEEIELPHIRTGYTRELGAFIMDNEPARISGGLKTSNKPAVFQSQKYKNERQWREEAWPKDERFKTERIKEFKTTPGQEKIRLDKHHLRVLATSEPFAYRLNEAGEFVKRDAGQIERINKRLQEDGIYLGNHDLNEVYFSKLSHIGDADSSLNKYAVHNILRQHTDIQGGLMGEAEFVEVLLKGETDYQWVKQISRDANGKELKTNQFMTRDGETITNKNIQKDGKTLMKRRFRNRVSKDIKELKAREASGQQVYRTYHVGQKYGWSEEAVEAMSKITDENLLYEQIKGYYAYTDEAQIGAAGIAAAIGSSGLVLDETTQGILQSAQFMHTGEFAEYLLKNSKTFENDPYLKAILKKLKRKAKDATRSKT